MLQPDIGNLSFKQAHRPAGRGARIPYRANFHLFVNIHPHAIAQACATGAGSGLLGRGMGKAAYIKLVRGIGPDDNAGQGDCGNALSMRDTTRTQQGQANQKTGL
ncbi:hypothetical protein AA0614_2395 [Komagataeibacter saccharivorans NRIC 0614]|nr:hypothetical protein AA0614_2395 [Komagataeibacter saccharivorans NRIC 0614]